MKIKVKKALKVTFLIILIISISLTSLFICFYFGIFSSFSTVPFDKTKLEYINTIPTIYNINNQNVGLKSSPQNTSLTSLPNYVKDAFISIEDKNFYTHSGINYKRILKALANNLSSLSFKEGASTISQQLIKNTHLTSEKTLSRKLNELLLTQQLEKNFSKDEILNAYLNVIYFGTGTFGIEQASQKYFSKSANQLTLAESATLSGIIKSPKRYSPISNPENCLKRRNLVLSEMLKDKKITAEECEKAKTSDLKLNLNFKTGNNDYISATMQESCEILGISEKDLLLKKYKIYTYLDEKKQENLEEIIQNEKNYPSNFSADSLAIVADNEKCGVSAYFGKSNFNLYNIKRQPGSVIKPILVYAPALENNVITPITPILDEKYKIDNYSPSNYKEKYNGWVSATTALAKSLNIPSIKILENLGIDKAKNFAKKLNINLSNNDIGYSIALGGLTDGLSPLSLTNSYQTLANNGNFKKLSFVKKIENEYGRVIYANNQAPTKVMRDDTAFLTTTMLKETVNNGTSKKLKSLKYEVAAKTGTVGDIDATNTDAWSLSYTTKNTICVWFGNTSTNQSNNLPQTLTGANYPTKIAKQIYETLDNSPTNFSTPASVENLLISAIDLHDNHIVKLATPSTPERYTLKSYFSKHNKPQEYSTTFETIDNFDIKAEKINSKQIKISIPTKKYISYKLIKATENEESILSFFQNKSGDVIYVDNITQLNKFYEYFVIASLDENFLKTNQSNKVKIYMQDEDIPSYIKHKFK